VTARTDYFETSISWNKLFKDFRDGVSNRAPAPSNICSERTLDHHCNFFFNKETVVRNISPSEVLPIFVELKFRDNIFKTCHYIVYDFPSVVCTLKTVYVTVYCIFTNKKRTLLHNTKPLCLRYTHESQNTVHRCYTACGTGMRQVTRCSVPRVRKYDRLFMKHYNIASDLSTLLNCLHEQHICRYIYFVALLIYLLKHPTHT